MRDGEVVRRLELRVDLERLSGLVISRPLIAEMTSPFCRPIFANGPSGRMLNSRKPADLPSLRLGDDARRPWRARPCCPAANRRVDALHLVVVLADLLDALVQLGGTADRSAARARPAAGAPRRPACGRSSRSRYSLAAAAEVEIDARPRRCRRSSRRAASSRRCTGPRVLSSLSRMIATDQRGSAGGGANMIASSFRGSDVRCSGGAGGGPVSVDRLRQDRRAGRAEDVPLEDLLDLLACRPARRGAGAAARARPGAAAPPPITTACRSRSRSRAPRRPRRAR